MLTGAGVVSVILGLAAQSTLGNLIAGVAFLLYRPFRVGDRLRMMVPEGAVTAVVEELTLGYTFLADRRSQTHRRPEQPDGWSGDSSCATDAEARLTPLSLSPPDRLTAG